MAVSHNVYAGTKLRPSGRAASALTAECLSRPLETYSLLIFIITQQCHQMLTIYQWISLEIETESSRSSHLNEKQIINKQQINKLLPTVAVVRAGALGQVAMSCHRDNNGLNL